MKAARMSSLLWISRVGESSQAQGPAGGLTHFGMSGVRRPQGEKSQQAGHDDEAARLSPRVAGASSSRSPVATICRALSATMKEALR